MMVVIVGAGKTGYSMAKMLTREKHDVVVIEQTPDRKELVTDTLAVQTILGNGVSSAILEQAGIKQADMLMALTQSDELNMLACLKAKHYGVKVTIARVSDTEYLQQPNAFLAEAMQIDLMLNPQQITAQHIAQIVQNPEALQVDYFADGNVQMVELLVEAGSPIAGKMMKELQVSHPFNIVSITRRQQTIVPRGDDIVLAGDNIHLMTRTADTTLVEKALGFNPSRIENICILGGGRTGYYLAKILEERKTINSIKLIEKNRHRAETVSSKLNRTLVLHGDGSDYDLLEGENIGLCDMFVAVTNDDQTNILCSLMTKTLGVKKTVTQVKRPELMPLAEQIGVDVALSPRILTAGAVLRYIRRGEIISVTVMDDESAEMIELLVQPGATAVNKRIMDIYFPRNALVGAIVSGDQTIIPDGQAKISAFDRVIVFCLPEEIHKVEKLFIGKGSFYG
jgi:trk system potassium uptake protein TrkA